MMSDEERIGQFIGDALAITSNAAKRGAYGVIITSFGAGMSTVLFILQFYGVDTMTSPYDIIRVLILTLVMFGMYIQFVWAKRKSNRETEEWTERLHRW